MTKLLLDTHVVFWWLMDAPLSAMATSAIGRSSTQAFVSIASVWEVAVKEGTGKLKPPEDFADAVRDEGFQILPIAVEHARAVRQLPLDHRDPFDRMLVAQARVEGLTLVTRDQGLQSYEVEVLRA